MPVPSYWMVDLKLSGNPNPQQIVLDPQHCHLVTGTGTAKSRKEKLKGIVQRKSTGVERGINRKVFVMH